MDEKRVREIMESHGVIDVFHEGIPVWIEALNGREAKVRHLEKEQHFLVAVGELQEG